MKTLFKSSLILFFSIQMYFAFDGMNHNQINNKKKDITLGEYMKKQQAKRKLAWERIQNMEVKKNIQRKPAVEPFVIEKAVIATEDYSNYREPAVLDNY